METQEVIVARLWLLVTRHLIATARGSVLYVLAACSIEEDRDAGYSKL